MAKDENNKYVLKIVLLKGGEGISHTLPTCNPVEQRKPVRGGVALSRGSQSITMPATRNSSPDGDPLHRLQVLGSPKKM